MNELTTEEKLEIQKMHNDMITAGAKTALMLMRTMMLRRLPANQHNIAQRVWDTDADYVMAEIEAECKKRSL